jgi:hypothetical protein
MYTSNLVSLLKTFSKEEFKNFGKFVRSPFFNTRKDIVRYYIYLKKFYPSFNRECFTKQNIFSHVYPGRKFNNGEFLKLSSSLTQLGLEFFNNKPDRIKDDLKILGELVDRNLAKQFLSVYKNLDSYIENKAEMDSLIFVSKINLESVLIRYFMNKDKQVDICGEIIKRGDYFSYQSLLWIMIQLRDMTTNFNSFNYPYEDSNSYKFIKSIDLEKMISEIRYEDNRLGRYVKYYLYSLLIYLHPGNENYFVQFKQSFQNIYADVNRLERNNYLARMQSFVMKHFQNGNTRYIPELLETYKFFFSTKGIFENDIIPLPPFRNCTLLASFIKDYDFLNKLIDVYSKKLHPDSSEDSVKLCLAYIYFGKKDYPNVFDILKMLNYRYAVHKLDVRILLLKTYFENGDFDYLISYSDSFRHFLINNKKISENHRKQFCGLISLTNHICSLKLKNDTDELKKLKNEIVENKFPLLVFDKLWLIEKIEEITVKK